MNLQIIVASLTQRPVRTAVSVLAVALEVSLILLIVGLTTGMATESGRRVEGVGADILLQAPNSSVLLALNSSVMPLAIGDKLREVEGVRAVTPVLMQMNSQGGLDIIYGIDVRTFDEVSGGFVFASGRMFSAPDEILVDDLYARSRNVSVGSEVQLLNQRFRVSGIVENGKGARIFMSIESASEKLGVVDKASMFYVKCETPELTDDVIGRFGQLLPGYPARSVREFTSLMTPANIPALGAFRTTVVIISLTIGLMVIFLSMYTTITERTREIGILRSLGASKSYIVILILQESGLIALMGFGTGLALSLVFAEIIPVFLPTQRILITTGWIMTAALAAIGSGLLGSLYPSLKAANQDPIEALAYE